MNWSPTDLKTENAYLISLRHRCRGLTLPELQICCSLSNEYRSLSTANCGLLFTMFINKPIFMQV